MQYIGDLFAVLTFAGATFFILLYGALAPWYRTPIGRNIMALMAVIALATGLATVTITMGLEWPYRLALRALIWFLIATVVWWRVALLVREQILARKQRIQIRGGHDA